MKIFLLTIFALFCFAFNSILCRIALKSGEIDAPTFTAIRLISGAVILLIIYNFFGKKDSETKKGSWLSAVFLFGYAICFSFAYINLTTATGALILFGSVQISMIAAALFKGEQPQILEWFGLIFAFGGLVYLVFPGLETPPILSSALMISAGIAWGFYTLRGKGSTNPLADTMGNFLRSVPFVILISVLFIAQIHLSTKGVLLAILSGAIASGVGYSVWYAALKHHTATSAAILQLAVPAIAAIGGVVFLSETISNRLIFASLSILGGIALAIFGRIKK